MYRVELSRRAFKSLERLEPETRHRILEKLVVLREEPIPRGAVKLRGEKDVYRLRVGDYRSPLQGAVGGGSGTGLQDRAQEESI